MTLHFIISFCRAYQCRGVQFCNTMEICQSYCTISMMDF